MNVEQLLAKKGDRVVTNRPEDTIEAAAQLLNVLRDYLIAKG